MIWVSIGALAHKDEPEGELHTRGRTDTDDDDWNSAEKHAWAASAEERATCARVPAMRGMRQSPQTPLGGPAVAASTQSDQRRSAGASFPRARHQRPCLAYTSNAQRGECRTARGGGPNRIARAGISRAIPGKSSLSSPTADLALAPNKDLSTRIENLPCGACVGGLGIPVWYALFGPPIIMACSGRSVTRLYSV